jgi:enamine deaminase RidA (YjgF/YER057c/UK114 family)
MEFLTPEGLKASPIFARVTRVDAARTIYTSGLLGKAGTSGEDQVREIFAQLKSVCDQTGSDFKHLAKATYYVAADDTSKQLNAIRPELYDPQRPPAASKAMVRGVGSPAHGIAVDMIAVPRERR